MLSRIGPGVWPTNSQSHVGGLHARQSQWPGLPHERGRVLNGVLVDR